MEAGLRSFRHYCTTHAHYGYTYPRRKRRKPNSQDHEQSKASSAAGSDEDSIDDMPIKAMKAAESKEKDKSGSENGSSANKKCTYVYLMYIFNLFGDCPLGFVRFASAPVSPWQKIKSAEVHRVSGASHFEKSCPDYYGASINCSPSSVRASSCPSATDSSLVSVSSNST